MVKRCAAQLRGHDQGCAFFNFLLIIELIYLCQYSLFFWEGGVGERSISLRKLIHATLAIFRRTGGAHLDTLIRMVRLLFSSMALAGTQLLDGLHFDFPTLHLIQNNSTKLRCTAPTKGRYGLPSVHRRYALLDGANNWIV